MRRGVPHSGLRVVVVSVLVLVLAGSPASAVSGLDAVNANSLCNIAKGLGTLSLLSFMGSDALDKASKSPDGPPGWCGNPECLKNPAHCAECAGKYTNWLKELDQAGSVALNTAGKLLGYGAGMFGVACTAPPADDNNNDGGNDDGKD